MTYGEGTQDAQDRSFYTPREREILEPDKESRFYRGGASKVIYAHKRAVERSYVVLYTGRNAQKNILI